MSKDLSHAVFNHLLFGFFDLLQLPHKQIENCEILGVVLLSIPFSAAFELRIVSAEILSN